MEELDDPSPWLWIATIGVPLIAVFVAIGAVELASWWGKKNKDKVIWKKEDGERNDNDNH